MKRLCVWNVRPVYTASALKMGQGPRHHPCLGDRADELAGDAERDPLSRVRDRGFESGSLQRGAANSRSSGHRSAEEERLAADCELHCPPPDENRLRLPVN